ncbi:hypothetical protein [Clostridium weizhouense]|uniref:Carboxypeptidase regulatory-like domain-containing protein n=1 Tax=Clostridium weizhouense TaxID=2859781 RepID=A0ABS7ALE2_9CLOT|nr:hypothetical protein [Clostridium weizhouense]MBW6409476.1 hypothetical protein [Clostridium weizhouense]
MKNKNSIILYGCKLMSLDSLQLDIIAKMKQLSIIKGKIYNENLEPSIGAVIEVKEINPYSKKYTILGYCFTNDKGEYVFSLEAKCGMDYEFSIYSPLI